MQLYQPTITGSLSVSGSINLSGSITIAGGGTISGTASLATTASYAVSASNAVAATTASFVALAQSATNAITASSADNFLVRNTLTAQTLVVQTITSSVDFVTGSTRFGSLSSNTHVFTGSMSVSGSLTGISATFTEDLVVNGWLRPNSIYAFTADAGTTYIQQPSGGNIVLRKSDSTAFLTIANSGAATFSSNITLTNGYLETPWTNDTKTVWERYNSATYFQRISSNAPSRQLILESNGAYGNAKITLDGQSNTTVTTTISSDNTTITGNLGIGITTTPSSIVYISAQSDTVGGNGIRLGNSAVSRIWNTRFATTDLSYNLDFYDGASWNNRLKLHYAGKLQAINSIAGDVAMDIRNTSSTGYGAAIQGGNGSGVYSFKVVNYNDSLTYFYVRGDGLIQTGTAAASPYNNTSGAAANMVVTSGGTLERSTSSLKYKTDIVNYDKGLAEVLKMRPVYYKSINEREKDLRFAGLIAEEIEGLGLTEFVQYAEDGTPDALAYQNMIALAFKAIQELKAEFDAYKATHP